MKVLLVLLLVSLSFSIQAEKLKNTLKNHPSPYLALHGTDPVAWQEWNKKTVERAKKEGKLIYVSSGYFSCHWCHVMQRESYKNAHVAKILNKHFVPVKVDREINSALDSRLIDFVERTQGQAGWPLNVFITPDGYPLVGMTYVPTKNFTEILHNLKTRWKNEKSLLDEIAQSATSELAAVADQTTKNIPTILAKEHITRFLSQAETMTDNMSGGFGEQNKFPSYPQLSLMLTAYENNPDKKLKQFLELSLNKMATQGLYDQLGGGFFRYTVDPVWQVPHFEKMLYDNALLASLYIDAGRILKNKSFSLIAKHTLDFMLDVFRSKEGVYIASLSALDDKGVEGGYYLWERSELKNILSKNELQITELIWQLEGAAELEGGHHLVEVINVDEAAKMLKIAPAKAEKYFLSAKKKMLGARDKRNIPQDNKLLGAWNGLALSAFSKAAGQFEDERYAKAAKDIKRYIKKNLWMNHSLVRAIKGNTILGFGGLEDYAYVAQGLYDWVEYSNNQQDKKWLAEIVNQAWKRFHNNEGWILSENSLLKYGQNEMVISDGVLPSVSATLISVSLSLAENINNMDLKKKALSALNIKDSNVFEQPFWYASHIKTLFYYQEK